MARNKKLQKLMKGWKRIEDGYGTDGVTYYNGKYYLWLQHDGWNYTKEYKIEGRYPYFRTWKNLDSALNYLNNH